VRADTPHASSEIREGENHRQADEGQVAAKTTLHERPRGRAGHAQQRGNAITGEDHRTVATSMTVSMSPAPPARWNEQASCENSSAGRPSQ